MREKFNTSRSREKTGLTDRLANKKRRDKEASSREQGRCPRMNQEEAKLGGEREGGSRERRADRKG